MRKEKQTHEDAMNMCRNGKLGRCFKRILVLKEVRSLPRRQEDGQLKFKMKKGYWKGIETCERNLRLEV